MTTALNKTSVKLHDQTEAYERRLRDEKAKTDAKVSLMNQIKERADKQHKEYSLMRMENAGVLDKLNAEIKDYEAEMKLARAHIADKNILIERMHEESVEKDKIILEGNTKLMTQISKLRSEAEDEKKVQAVRMRQTQFKHSTQMDYIYKQFNVLFTNASCLGCDKVKVEVMMLICGHNICRTCLNSYSSTNHPKSSIRCEVCNLETKVLNLTLSKPHIQIAEVIIQVQEFMGRNFHADMAAVEEQNSKREVTYSISSRAVGETEKVG